MNISKMACLLVLQIFIVSLAQHSSVIAYEPLESDKIYWDKNNPLQWSDFEGEIGIFPDYFNGEKGNFDAFTSTWFVYDYDWDYTQEQPCMYQIIYADTWVFFLKNQSWVTQENTTDSELLNHEQRHFDIYKIGELKLNEFIKQEFLNKEFACPSTFESLDDVIEQKISNDFEQADASITAIANQMNIDYDDQTDHYFDKEQQEKWNKKIDCLLKNSGKEDKCETTEIISQIESQIPEWIKVNAKWWAEGGIGDSDFVSGIQYLIKEGIMKIPATTQGAGSGSNEIPEWIKTNAEWWADGQIDDGTFVSGIQYLIKEGIMKISS